MQACNAHGMYCVPLYDTLGIHYFMYTKHALFMHPNASDMLFCNLHPLESSECIFYGIGATAVEFIICHAEVKIAFVEEKKIPEVHVFHFPIHDLYLF